MRVHDDDGPQQACRVCARWSAHHRSDGNGVCAAVDAVYGTGALLDVAVIAMQDDNVRGLDATLVTGPDFGCTMFSERI